MGFNSGFKGLINEKQSLISNCRLVLNVQTPGNYQKERKYKKKPVCKVISNSKTFGDISPKVYF